MMTRSRHCDGRFGLFLLVALAACRAEGEAPVATDPLATSSLDYPRAPRGDVVDEYHGILVPDEYRGLEDLNSPDTLAWVARQNELAQSMLATLPSRAAFARRVRPLLAVPPSPRVRRQATGWVTRMRTPDGDLRFTHQDELGGPERVLLDADDVRDLGGRVREVAPSPDGRLLAYVVDRRGPAALELRFRDLESGLDLPERIPGVKWGLPAWTADGGAVIYSRLLRPGIGEPDGVDRESVIGCHVMGSSPDEDLVLYRTDPAEVGAAAVATLSSDGRLVVIDDSYAGADGIRVIDLGDPLDPNLESVPVRLTTGREGSSRFLGSVGRSVYLLTTRGAPLGRIVVVDLDDPRDWRTVVPEGEHLLERALIADGRLLVGRMRDARSDVRVHDLEGGELFTVALPALGSAYYFSGDDDTPEATFAFDSFTRPEAVFGCDMRTGAIEVVHSPAIDTESDRYRTDQLFCESSDGTRVPYFLARREEIRGPAPVLLYGYGAVGDVMGPVFHPALFAWIEAGGVLAVANVRGGGEYGESWHRSGMLEHKQNTFDDFIAVAEHLVASGVTTTERLAVHGHSNGGLLVGAVMTQRPDLFAAALPVVGVLDGLRFPSFTAGPRWAKEMGDPAVPEQFEWIRAWSPLHRVEDGQRYPATLVTTARDDDVVHPSQSYKFAARLQRAQGGEAPIILRVYPGGGHSGRSDLDGRVEELADRLGFAAHFTGLEARPE